MWIHTLVTRGTFKIEFKRFYIWKMYSTQVGMSPETGSVEQIVLGVALRLARYVVFTYNVINMSSSRRFRGSVDVVVGGVGGANVEDRTLGVSMGVSIRITDMSAKLDSFVERTSAAGS